MTMRLTWLWLEDEESTVVDLMEEAKRRLDVRHFRRVVDLTRWLLDHRKQIEGGEIRVGMILDVMIRGAHAVTRPKDWFPGEDEQTFLTQSGYQAGLVFYETLVLPEREEGEKLFFPAPPPALFLTVLHTDHEGINARVDVLKQRWREKRPKGGDEACLRWCRKWDVSPSDLVSLLQKWEEVVR